MTASAASPCRAASPCGAMSSLTLSSAGDRVLRYDPVRVASSPLAEVGLDGLTPPLPSGAHREPRRFRRAANIALFRSWLYVADPEAHRVQVFDLETLALLRIHGVDDPVDVAAGADGVYWLDRARGRVYTDHPGLASPRLVVRAPYRAGRWDRIAVDSSGRLYLRDARSDPHGLDVFEAPPPDRPAKPMGRVRHPAQVRDRFAPPAVRSDEHGHLVATDRLLDPCGLRRPPAAGEPSWWLGDTRYVVDREARVVRVHLKDGRIRHRFGPYDAAGQGVPADAPEAWRPADAVALDGRMLVLDARHQQVYEHRLGDGAMRRRLSAPAAHPRRWTRIATDGTGCLLLWDGGPIVDRADQGGRLVGELSRREASAHFAPSRTEPVETPPPAVRLTRDGVLVEPVGSPRWPEPAYERHGLWVSEWLDSSVFDCQWDVLDLTLAALPPGATVTVRTRTTASVPAAGELPPFEALSALGSWSQPVTLAGEAQPAAERPHPPTQVLVASPNGRYLQCLIELVSDGTRVPIVASLRVRFPRESWLQYLPAIYAQPDEQRSFLDRYLAIAQATWTGLEAELESFERYLDPRAVPAEALPYLANWLDLQLDGSLTADQHRQLLQALPDLWRHWGTVAGLRTWVRVHLAVLSGLDVELIEKSGLPGIVERFVERRHLIVQPPGESTRVAPQALWSPSVERRFQVGVFDREGEIALVSIGDPEEDVFRHYAHAFRVYVPAAWVPSPAAQALLQRAIDLQRPAHTSFSLVLVEPRFRIGGQSTLGLDSVIGGDNAPWRVSCAADPAASGRTTGSGLGIDSTLGGSRPGSRAGVALA